MLWGMSWWFNSFNINTWGQPVKITVQPRERKLRLKNSLQGSRTAKPKGQCASAVWVSCTCSAVWTYSLFSADKSQVAQPVRLTKRWGDERNVNPAMNSRNAAKCCCWQKVHTVKTPIRMHCSGLSCSSNYSKSCIHERHSCSLLY